MDEEAPHVGHWFAPELPLGPDDCADRHAEATRLAQRILASGATAAEAKAVEAYLPAHVPCVALCSPRGGLLQSWATGTLIRDQAGPCLVTALHAICSRDGRYHAHYVDHGLAAISVRRHETVPLFTRQWSCYDALDIALTPLTEEEARMLGGAPTVVNPSEALQPAFWCAFGFPSSANRQLNRLRPMSLQGARIMLYEQAPFPSLSRLDPAASNALRYNPKRVLDPVCGRMRQGRDPSGCSGGLLAGYYPTLGCWLMLGIVTEWHAGTRVLVATRLPNVFGAAN